MPSGQVALSEHAPLAAAALASVERAAWADVAAVGFGDLLVLSARACGSLHGLTPLAPPAGSQPARWDEGVVGDWPQLEGLSANEQRILSFAEQCSLDVSAVTPEDRSAFLAAAGGAAGTLAAALWVVDFLPRTRKALDALFSPGPWPEAGPSRAGPDLWSALDGLVRAVPQLDALDPITSELVRLRGARQHNCRLCRSLRSRPSLRAGADEAVFDAVDDYRGSVLSPLQQAALAFTDGMVWTPGHLDRRTVDELRSLTDPRQQVELVLDVTRNALNKVAVALGADDPHVEDGVEVYDVAPDGGLVYGLAPD